MSVSLTCPHCRCLWTPGSRRESASVVCMKCRATPAFAACEDSTGCSPAPGGPVAKRKVWLAAAGCAGLFLLIGAGAQVVVTLRHSVAAAPPVTVAVAAAPENVAESVNPPISAKTESPKVEAAGPVADDAYEVEPAPAPRPEIPPVEKPTPALAAQTPTPEIRQPIKPPQFKRMRPAASADALIRQLYQVKEIELDKPHRNNAARDLLVFAAQHRDELPRPTPPIFSRYDLVGMPIRMGMDCHLGKESAEALQILSRKLRSYMSESVAEKAQNNRTGVEDPRPSAEFLRGKFEADGEKTWAVPEAAPALVQVLQAEDRPLRLLLVEMLAKIDGCEATKALAQRAMFDLAADVREAAVNALRDRPGDDVRHVLIDGLRYPWPAAAEFAAEALVNLGDKSAVPQLAKLLDDPDPAAPYRAGKGSKAGYYVREIVRVNHLRNCMMCHSASLGQNELVRAPVPNQGQPLPPAFSPAYYQAPPSPGSMFVRADVTYLKQDFSAPQAVASHGPWPEHQRYDYFVRLKQAPPVEKAVNPKAHVSYPQKDAVLFALRELTGENLGDTTADWQPYLRRMQKTN